MRRAIGAKVARSSDGKPIKTRSAIRLSRVSQRWNRASRSRSKRKVDWDMVLTRHKEAGELRTEKLSAHSTILRALGGLGQDLMKSDDWRTRLSRLQQIDWSKKNQEWENICITANSVVSNRQARAATKVFVKFKLGMELTAGEKRLLEKSPAFTAVSV